MTDLFDDGPLSPRNARARDAARRAPASEDDRRRHRPAPPARAGQAARRRVRLRQAAFDDPVGPAGRRQDHARAADGATPSTPSSSRSRRCSPASRTSATRSRAPSSTRAQSGRATILFVDEVHRFNKAQQDAFLPFVEQGLLTFIGATTENPSFEVNSALLSRAAVYVLEPLSPTELAQLLDRALTAAMPAVAIDDGRARRAGRLRRRRRPPAHQPRRAARDGGRRSAAATPIDVAFVEDDDRAQPAPLRQGRRGVLRPDLGAAQVGARLATPTPRSTGCAGCSTAAPIRSTSAGA